MARCADRRGRVVSDRVVLLLLQPVVSSYAAAVPELNNSEIVDQLVLEVPSFYSQ